MKIMKYLLYLLGLLVLLVASYWAVINIVIDKDEILAQLLQEVEQTTGYRGYSDSVAMSVFPVPVITISDFRVKNNKNAATAYFFQTKKVEITLDLISMFSENKKASQVSFMHPILELQQFPNGQSNWDFINSFRTANKGDANFDFIKVINGKVNYSTINKEGGYHKFSKLNITLSNIIDNHLSILGRFNFAQEKLKVDAKLDFNNYQSTKIFSTQIDARLVSGGGSLEYKGKITRNNNGFSLNGRSSADFSDARKLIEYLTNVQQANKDFTNEPLPFKASVDFVSNEVNRHSLNNMSMTVSGMNMIGVGTLEEHNNKPYFNLKLKGDRLDARNILSSSKVKSSIENIIWNILTSNIEANLDIEIQSIKFSEKLSAKASFQGLIENGEMVVNQSRLDLPGESQFLSFGIIRPEDNNKIQLDGWVELIGKSFNEFTDSLGKQESISFADHNGSFKSKANIFLSFGQTIISGLKFRAGDLYLVGGINMKNGYEKVAESSLRISGIKLDDIVKYLFPNIENSKTPDGIGKSFDSYSRNIPWLDDITKSSVFEVVLDDFIFDDIKGKSSAFRVTIEPKAIKAENIKINFGDKYIKGDINFIHTDTIPKVSGDITLSHLNMPSSSKYLRTFPVPRGNYTGVWDSTPYDFSYLKGYDTDLKIRVLRFKHNDFEVKNLKAMVIGSVGKIKIDKLSGSIWGGKVKGSGFIDISSIPIFRGTFSFNNILANKLTETFASQDNFDGIISFNGQFNSLGIAPQDWVKNFAGSFLIYGQDIAIKGFNLSGVVKAIPSVRSVGDVVNIVRTSLLRRKTSFSVIDAGFYAKDGIIYITKLKLRSRHAIGNGYGSLDLISWAMNLNTIFKFVTLSNKDMPTLGIHFVDSMDDPVAKLDTRSLEAFVARRKLRK